MIKFFRKIRQRLLSENKFSKYFLYAIGEIVLVVIGILIALQINNWNEAKKDQAFEKTMLSEVTRALGTDQKNFQSHIDAYTELSNSVDYFTNLSKNNVLFHDSLKQRLWSLNIGKYYQFNRGPYDALKSSGIDRISNDSLRNHLINFFDFELLIHKNQIEHITRRYISNVEGLLSLLSGSYIDENNNRIEGRIPKDLFQKPEFINLLGDIDWRADNAKKNIEKFTLKIEGLIQQLNNEIER